MTWLEHTGRMEERGGEDGRHVESHAALRVAQAAGGLDKANREYSLGMWAEMRQGSEVGWGKPQTRRGVSATAARSARLHHCVVEIVTGAWSCIQALRGYGDGGGLGLPINGVQRPNDDHGDSQMSS